MEHARNVCRMYRGVDAEARLYQEHGYDIDKYIDAVGKEPSKGLMCKKCNKNTAAIELYQTRSADEGMTAYIVCSACRHKAVFK